MMTVTTRLLKPLLLMFFRVKIEQRERFYWKKKDLILIKIVEVILANLLISEENNMNGLNATDKES